MSTRKNYSVNWSVIFFLSVLYDYQVLLTFNMSHFALLVVLFRQRKTCLYDDANDNDDDDDDDNAEYRHRLIVEY